MHARPDPQIPSPFGASPLTPWTALQGGSWRYPTAWVGHGAAVQATLARLAAGSATPLPLDAVERRRRDVRLFGQHVVSRMLAPAGYYGWAA